MHSGPFFVGVGFTVRSNQCQLAVRSNSITQQLDPEVGSPMSEAGSFGT